MRYCLKDYERTDFMRKKTKILRIAALFTAAAGLPFAVSAAVQNPPDVSELMTAAVNFTANVGYSTESVVVGSGGLILYKPESGEKTEQTTMNVPETTENLTTTEPAEIVSTTENAALPEPEQTQEAYIITRNISEQREDLTVFADEDGIVENNTYSANGGTNFLNLPSGAQVRNCTELSNDYLKAEMEQHPDFTIEAGGEEPQVLIMHTHACESYLVTDSGYFDEEYTSRTTDPTQSVIAVGAKIAEQLAKNGICVVHDGTLHDYPQYNGAYDRAEQTISEILEKYPSIKVVLDVHRDAIEDDGARVAAVTEINGKKAAQMMIISAASDGYYYVPNYIENFHFACLLQDQIESDNAGLTRPMLLDYCQYNQHLTTGSLLIEVGSHGNTLEQALYTGELIGESIAKALLSLT